MEVRLWSGSVYAVEVIFADVLTFPDAEIRNGEEL